ncbi:MAG: DUF1566 domain-containing protein [Alphaproteobacteria bacterium]|nr:DUF1566 domain-containing protein [Alphaproteobacteria bacterium]
MKAPPPTIPGTGLTVAPKDGPLLYTTLDNTESAQKSDDTNPTQAEIDAPTNTVGYVNYVNRIALCGFTDWRLPTLKELRVMYQHREVLGIVGGWYWSSSPYVDYSDLAWGVSFNDGNVDDCDFRYGRNHVRLVR